MAATRLRTSIVVACTVLMVTMLALPALGIVYGEPDDGRHPFVGSMVLEGEEGAIDQVCSGTLISPTVFLTAAHCTTFVESLGMDRVAVTFDGVITPDATLHWGTPFSHPDFGFSGPGGLSDPHDIAVIVFDDPVTSITPAGLPAAGLLSQMHQRQLRATSFTAVGYGTIRETRRGAFESILDNLERRLARQEVLSLAPAWLTLSMNQATGNGGTCYGDSGGPHFITGTNTIVSITVTGDAPCKATDKTYRIDTASAREFLGQFVQLP